jgi:hypothetical protein
MHADGWIHIAKMAFFVALGFVHFASESRPTQQRVPCTPALAGGARGEHGLTKTVRTGRADRTPLARRIIYHVVEIWLIQNYGNISQRTNSPRNG